MKRHDALIPLSHDHQHALARALRLRRAADLDAEGRREGAIAFLEFVAALPPHFAEEERLLAEAVAAAPGDAGLAEERERLMTEHAALVARFDRLRAEVDAGGELDAQAVRETGQALTDHVRYEERELFERLQRTFGEELETLRGVGRG